VKEAKLELGSLAERAFEAVIFDMDGTLIDSTAAVARAWKLWAEEHDVTAEELADNHGIPSAAVVAKLLPQERHLLAIERINELELADVEGIVVLPGAAEALAALRNARNAIATSCTIALAKARIDAAQLVPPSIMVTADDVEHGKPAPDPYLAAARQLSIEPSRCLVVEDAPAGLTSARAAGCATLAVITTTPRERLDADAVVPDLSYVRFLVVDGLIHVTPAGG
jgi:mannitol-1-/sugar-/sorbitol-6-phosphatase